MKLYSLHLDSPCPEDISNIKRNASGFFCDLCTKHVLDLTKMTPEEILNLLNKSNGNICASVTKEQLQTPIIYFDKPKPVSKLPYSKLAAGIMLATSLTNPPNLEAQNYSPYIQTELNTPILHKDHEYIEQQMPEPPKTIVFEGKVISNNTQKPVDKAKVELITLDGFYSTYTDSNGTFTLNIPKHLIKEKNIFRISHSQNISIGSNKHNFETDDYILIRQELNSYYTFYTNKETLLISGGLRHSTPIPTIIYNGIELSYYEYSKMIRGKFNRYKLENKNYYYFDGYLASILLERPSRDGLYFFFD